jgi:hypothetical protein
MASISKQPNGHKTIQFNAPCGRRKSIRLGRVSLRAAEALKFKIEQIVSSKITGHALDDETSRWLANADQVLLN